MLVPRFTRTIVKTNRWSEEKTGTILNARGKCESFLMKAKIIFLVATFVTVTYLWCKTPRSFCTYSSCFFVCFVFSFCFVVYFCARLKLRTTKEFELLHLFKTGIV